MHLRRLFALMVSSIAGLFLCACAQTDSGTWTGRRWYVHSPQATCRFWGYLKRPGDSWRHARLVILDERNGVRPPDRALVAPGPPFCGDDHNCEYEVQGQFTDRRAYDPGSDLELPLFVARSFRLVSRNPGPLPGVGMPQDNGYVPGREAAHQLSARLR